MEIRAVAKFVRMSPSKAQALVRKIRGLAVGDALKITEFAEGKAGRFIGKTLKSAIANAKQANKGASTDELTVKRAVVDEGPRWKRAWPRARGSASPILKRMCHVTVVLTDGKEDEGKD